MTQEGAVPPDFWARIEQMIDRKVAELARSGMTRNSSIGEGGTFTIRGGQLRVLYPASQGGATGVYFGDLYSTMTGVYLGTGLLIQDTDGTDIATFRSDPASGYPQVVLRDGTENPVLYTDTVAGIGFGRPWFSGAFYPSRYTDWPGTVSGTFETLYRAKVSKQNPSLLVQVWGVNDAAGATGEIRVLVNNAPLGSIASTNSSAITERQFYGSVAGDFGDDLVVEIQARLASGAGQVRVGPSNCLGRS